MLSVWMLKLLRERITVELLRLTAGKQEWTGEMLKPAFHTELGKQVV